jgi:hypothetical protein
MTAALITGVLALSAALAQTPKLLKEFKDWDAFAYSDDGGKVCYMVSKPLASEPRTVKRGDIYVMVTHRPAEKVVDEVSIFAGYPYKEESEAEVTIGGTKFALFTQGENAWTREAKEDKALVRAMIRGSTMIVRGVSKRGTLTTDTYSLSGFTAAHKAIDQACKTK